jgi:transglutaminase-like putative cysteine protease
MKRDVTAHLTLDVARPAFLVLSIAVAQAYGADETLSASLDGRPVRPRGVLDQHGTRLHVLEPGVGELAPLAGEEVDRLRYLRPSRYAESDVLWATARAEFAGLAGSDLLSAVSSWVGTRLAYVTGSSLPTDGAERTLLARRGVCRDFAHLVVALLRALDVPARLVSVYAPGLQPMDFHAVAEAWIEGEWRVVDATTLAPRQSLVRIATGRDAADTAFLSVYDGVATLGEFTVGAVVDVLPDDDVREPVSIG